MAFVPAIVLSTTLNFKQISSSDDLLSPNLCVGSGFSSRSALVHLRSSGPNMRFEDTAGGYGVITTTQGNVIYEADKGATKASSYHAWTVDNVEKARLTSTGLGVGKSSPSTMLDVAGSVTISSQLLADSGSAAAPSMSFSSDPDSGLYRIGANNIGISTGGTNRVDVSASGVVLTPHLTVTNAAPAINLIETGNTYSAGLLSNGDAFKIRGLLTSDGSPTNIFYEVNLGASGATQHSFYTGSAEQVRIIADQVQFQDGSAAAPGISFRLDTNTGLFRTGADEIGFTRGGAEAMRLNATGLGVGTRAPSAKLDVNGNAIRVRTSQTPASASATGNAGTICWDSNYLYVCVATNTWKRVALSTW